MVLEIFFLILYAIFPMIDNGFVSVRMHPNSIFNASSPCSFFRNTNLANDPSINSCVWECVYEPNCQTANYDHNRQICSLFKEECQSGSIHSPGSDSITVICSRKAISNVKIHSCIEINFSSLRSNGKLSVHKYIN